MMKVSTRVLRTAVAFGAVLSMAIPLAVSTRPPAARAAGVGPVASCPAGNAAYAVTTADLNEDGKLDAAVASQGDPSVYTLLGDGAGKLGP
ncbi:MAG TPA: VCBS repeat-containing protein, partial [Actinomycetota bacterium]